MKLENRFTPKARSTSILIAFTACAILVGCSSVTPSRKTSEAERAAQQKGGAQLWAARCAQCHFARDPGTFSPEQWEIIMLHMRVRANLTAWESDSILEFLKSAN